MGKSAPSFSPRELTEEELQMFDAQSAFLEQASAISEKQFGLSEEDREYFNKIYRGELDKNDPKVKEEVAKRIADIPKPTMEQFQKANSLIATPTDNTRIKEIEAILNSSDDAGVSPFEYSDLQEELKELREKINVTEATTILDKEAYDTAMAEWESTVADITKSVQQDLGSVSVDEMLFDAVKSASPKTNELMDNWYSTAKSMGDDYIGKLEGLSQEFKDNIIKSTGEYKSSIKQSESKYVTKMEGAEAKYTGRAEDIASKMGTADQDIYARTKGENLAGISQAYQEALKQSQGALARRGLAGTGIEAGVVSNLMGAEARDKATSLSRSYVSAIDQSDVRRQNQLGIYGSVLGATQGTAQNVFSGEQQVAGSIYGAETSAAQNIYSSGVATADKAYQAQMATEASNLQNQLSAQQQNISNLGMLSGVSQGVYSGSQNYLAGAGQTAVSGANSAGGTFGSMFSSNNNLAASQAQAAASSSAGIGSLVGTLGGAAIQGAGAAAAGGSTAGLAAMFSDIRLKRNINYIETIDGHNVYEWDWIEGFDGGYNKGVLAQEVQRYNPEAISVSEDGYLMVDYSSLGLDSLVGGK